MHGSHDHHHRHAHRHGAQHRRVAVAVPMSLLRLSALQRLGGAGGLIAAIWLGVFWALA